MSTPPRPAFGKICLKTSSTYYKLADRRNIEPLQARLSDGLPCRKRGGNEKGLPRRDRRARDREYGGLDDGMSSRIACKQKGKGDYLRRQEIPLLPSSRPITGRTTVREK